MFCEAKGLDTSIDLLRTQCSTLHTPDTEHPYQGHLMSTVLLPTFAEHFIPCTLGQAEELVKTAQEAGISRREVKPKFEEAPSPFTVWKRFAVMCLTVRELTAP